MALLLKEKPDGSIKSRLLIDLLRSGANGQVVVPERVVLPRLSDFVAGIIDVMEADVGRCHGPVTDMYEICTVDFEDAFHTLHLKERDRGTMVFRTREGWAFFSRLCCGMAAAPLLWSGSVRRAAASRSRASASTSCASSASWTTPPSRSAVASRCESGSLAP